MGLYVKNYQTVTDFIWAEELNVEQKLKELYIIIVKVDFIMLI